MSNYEKQIFHREVNLRVNKKMKEYEDSIDGRRKKLADLMWTEEREQIKEVVDDAQRGEDDMLLKMKIRTQELRAQREAERLAIVKEKKLQQYLERCEEFRPIIANRRLLESKETQLIQMQDNQSRKQTERETEHMWYEILLKEIQAQTDRERQDDFNLRKRNADDKSVWDMQCKAKELQREDRIREIREDAIKMNTLKEVLIREEIADLDAKRRKRDLLYREAMLQMKENQESLAKKAQVEESYARTNARLVWEEKQREKVSNEKERMKQEMHQYRDYIARLDQERREEEKRLNELVEQELKEIQKKQDAARCKYDKARQALKETVMNERKEQLEYRRQEAEEQLNMKQAENQLIQMAYDQNERMRAEYARQQLLTAKQYGDDLKKQIEYSKLLKEREKEELENKILQGKAEEEEYKNTLLRIMKNDVKISEEHPFRRVLNITHP
ncbi:hypothetical protein CBL_08142 [Carabus blaptoides fortunei]